MKAPLLLFDPDAPSAETKAILTMMHRTQQMLDRRGLNGTEAAVFALMGDMVSALQRDDLELARTAFLELVGRLLPAKAAA